MSNILDRVQVTTPCSETWETMTGNGQVRFCSHCNLDVHNLSALTRKQAERLVAKSDGRLCVRYVRKANGAMVTWDETYDSKPSSHFPAMMASTLSVVLAANSAALAQSSPSEQSGQKTRIEIIRSTLTNKSDPQPTTATIKGTIVDQNAALVTAAIVTLLSNQGSPIAKTVSDAEGQFQFQSLSQGSYALKAEAKGFAEFGIHNLHVNPGDEIHITAPLHISLQICETIVIDGSMSMTTVGVLEVRKRRFWDWVVYVVTAPYREGKKIFSRDP